MFALCSQGLTFVDEDPRRGLGSNEGSGVTLVIAYNSLYWAMQSWYGTARLLITVSPCTFRQQTCEWPIERKHLLGKWRSRKQNYQPTNQHQEVGQSSYRSVTYPFSVVWALYKSASNRHFFTFGFHSQIVSSVWFLPKRAANLVVPSKHPPSLCPVWLRCWCSIIINIIPVIYYITTT